MTLICRCSRMIEEKQNNYNAWLVSTAAFSLVSRLSHLKKLYKYSRI